MEITNLFDWMCAIGDPSPNETIIESILDLFGKKSLSLNTYLHTVVSENYISHSRGRRTYSVQLLNYPPRDITNDSTTTWYSEEIDWTLKVVVKVSVFEPLNTPYSQLVNISYDCRIVNGKNTCIKVDHDVFPCEHNALMSAVDNCKLSLANIVGYRGQRRICSNVSDEYSDE